ncbi:MAG: hypothetical protein ABIK15_00995 [Pseudomonadota bacterium]|nr:MAG: hypothetical protein C4522_06320 [Desulfobacteraceae bacterium]
MKWPAKKEREGLEVQNFIKEYQRLALGRRFVVEEERENPDRVLRDIKTNEKFGLELTSVYLNNRSVPDAHMRQGNRSISINPSEIEQYERRILRSVVDKVCKARHHYRLEFPLILSVYVNEYVSLFMELEYWKAFSSRYNLLFDCFSPFTEIVFWPLPSADRNQPLVVSVRVENCNT